MIAASVTRPGSRTASGCPRIVAQRALERWLPLHRLVAMGPEAFKTTASTYTDQRREVGWAQFDYVKYRTTGVSSSAQPKRIARSGW